MSETHLQVEHPCPQCGAPVTLDESDTFLQCQFCRVRLCISSQGDHMRFFMPPKDPSRETIYIPYWRFRGMRFSVRSQSVAPKIVDTSFRGVEVDFMPDNLGFRSQTMKLRFASPKGTERYLPPTLDVQGVVQRVEQSTITDQAMAAAERVHYTAFMGETISNVYVPIHPEGRAIYDGLTGRPLGTLNFKREELLAQAGPLGNWNLKFLAAQCPSCGWDLEGGRDSVAFLCRNCDSAWRLGPRGMVKVPFGVVHGNDRDVLYIPFWRIKAEFKGIAASSYADIIRLGNLPKVVRPEHEQEEMYYWFPAVRVSPQAYLRLSTLVTHKRPGRLFGERITNTFKRGFMAPVNLPAVEAADVLKPLLVELAIKKYEVAPLLPQIEATALGMQLVYFPFDLVGTDFFQKDLQVSFQRTAFRGKPIPLLPVTPKTAPLLNPHLPRKGTLDNMIDDIFYSPEGTDPLAAMLADAGKTLLRTLLK